MKLIRYGPAGEERPGILDNHGGIRDASALVTDWAGANLDPDFLDGINPAAVDTLPVAPEDARIGPCVGAVGSFVCIGVNYADHAAETGIRVPDEPIVFMKSTGAVSGPDDPIIIPRGSTMTDWEVELGVVIGRTARYVAERDALSYVAGYCTANDVSEREFQAQRSGQWVKGKSADSFGPIGPWLVTKDEVADPQNLDLWLEIDGERMQDGNTASMIVGAAALVSYVSQFFTLRPGDVISTGTPAGVGVGRNPPRFLKPGERVRLSVEGLGEQNHLVVSVEEAGH